MEGIVTNIVKLKIYNLTSTIWNTRNYNILSLFSGDK